MFLFSFIYSFIHSFICILFFKSCSVYILNILYISILALYFKILIVSLYYIYLVLGPLCKPLLAMERPIKRLLLSLEKNYAFKDRFIDSLIRI